MTTVLLILLIALDFGLLACVFFLNRKQSVHGNTILELTEERRLLEEARASIQDELSAARRNNKSLLDKVSHIATEAEQEVKSGGQALAERLQEIVTDFHGQIEQPLSEFERRQKAMESLLRRIDHQKELLQKVVSRGERICKFFDRNVPYDEILTEIEDKKYLDARAMLARGMNPSEVASEVGMSEPEVRIIAGLAISP